MLLAVIGILVLFDVGWASAPTDDLVAEMTSQIAAFRKKYPTPAQIPPITLFVYAGSSSDREVFKDYLEHLRDESEDAHKIVVRADTGRDLARIIFIYMTRQIKIGRLVVLQHGFSHGSDLFMTDSYERVENQLFQRNLNERIPEMMKRQDSRIEASYWDGLDEAFVPGAIIEILSCLNGDSRGGFAVISEVGNRLLKRNGGSVRAPKGILHLWVDGPITDIRISNSTI